MDKKLKAYLNVAKNNTRVLGPIERYLMVRPKDTSRRTDSLHPSEMVSDTWCHRASYYHLSGRPVLETRTPSLTLETVFEEGHSIHRRWQRWLQEMGNLYGQWHCQGCGEVVWDVSSNLPIHEPCGKVWKYEEVPLNYEPLRITGHSDGWLKGLGDDMMLEIKSIGVGTLRFEAPELLMQNNNDFDKAWKDLNAPFMKHIMQVQLYMKLAELLGMDAPQQAVLIYEAKPNQKAKEFVIPKSDFGITQLLDAAAMIVKAVEDGIPPVCNISPNGCDKCKGYND